MNSSDVHLSPVGELEKVILEVDVNGGEEDDRAAVNEASIGK